MHIFLIFIGLIIIIALINQISDNKKLTDCKTCGAKISKNAKCCPHCGAQPAGQILGEAIGSIGCSLIMAPLFIFVIIIYVVIIHGLK